MKINVLVATHKKYWMPSDDMYIPLHVGAKGKEMLGYLTDDTGDNISHKNPNYCELTGLYWAWKNLEDVDYLGLVHYRRHFAAADSKGEKKECVLDRIQLEKMLLEEHVILPKARNYYIETNYSQYIHAHNAQDLDITRQIIVEKYPEYLTAYDLNMGRTYGHRFNMFIMKRDILDAYCFWLFEILFELESRLDISEYSKYDARVFGFVSERLLDVWLETNHINYLESPYIFMEKENWVKKIANFLKRKFITKRRSNDSR